MKRLPADTAAPLLAEDYDQRALAENSRMAYDKDLKRFKDWGGTIPSNPEQIRAYLAEHATHKPATLQRWMASISVAHQEAGFDSPTKHLEVRRAFAGIKNTYGSKQRQVAPAVREEIEAMIATVPDNLTGLRDRALLMIGFSAALRRSSLSALQMTDLKFDNRGLTISVGKSKTNQSGEKHEVAVPYGKGDHCPVLALKEWLKAADIKEGPVFRKVKKNGKACVNPLSAGAIAEIVKKRAASAGLDPDNYSGHSMRAGLATSAAREKKPFHKIKAQTGHRSDVMLMRYVRDAQLFDDNAADLW